MENKALGTSDDQTRGPRKKKKISNKTQKRERSFEKKEGEGRTIWVGKVTELVILHGFG